MTRALHFFSRATFLAKVAGRIGFMTALTLAVGCGLRAQQLANMTLADVTSGKNLSLHELAGGKALLIVFTSTTCPYDAYYVDRIRSLVTEFGSGISIVLANAHTQPEESAAEMKKWAAREHFSLPYLADKEQLLMQNLGATKSPEVFLLRTDRGAFSIVYRGAIDNNPQVAHDVSQSYVRTALQQFLSGRTVTTPQTRPVGCSMRKR